MGKSVECQFNIFNEERKYTGHHRKYLLDNAKKVLTSEATKEKVRLRECLGYYGHGRRILAGKMNLAEVEAVKLPNGDSAIISNIPSNVTTAISIAEDGTVIHTQDILDTDTGKIVASLHDSKVGGFSWACPGSDGGKLRATIMSGFSGMDYVLNPGFAMNRGYVLESADPEEGGISADLILESISKVTGEDNGRAEALLKGWAADAEFMAMDLQERLENAVMYEASLLKQLEDQAQDYHSLESEKKAAVDAQLAERKAREETIKFIIDSSPFFIPENVQHAMMENDFEKARSFFEKAKAINFNSLPIDQSKFNQPEAKKNGSKDQEYGSVSTAWRL